MQSKFSEDSSMPPGKKLYRCRSAQILPDTIVLENRSAWHRFMITGPKSTRQHFKISWARIAKKKDRHFYVLIFSDFLCQRRVTEHTARLHSIFDEIYKTKLNLNRKKFPKKMILIQYDPGDILILDRIGSIDLNRTNTGHIATDS